MKGVEAETQVVTGTPDCDGQPTARVGAGGGPTQPKLRGSCHTCSTSKVKCPKEKPTCSRCKTRGVACQYFFTRRPGRRREGSTSRITNSDGNTSSKTSTSGADRRTSVHSQSHHRPVSSPSPASEHRNDAAVGSSDDGREDNNHDTIQVMPRLLIDAPFSVATASPTAGSVAGGNNYLETPMSISTYPELENMSAIDPGDHYPALDDNAMFPEMMIFEHNLDDFEFEMPDQDRVSFELPSLAGFAGSNQVHNDTASILMQVPPERSSLGLISPQPAPPPEDFCFSTSSAGSSLAASMQSSLLDKGKGMAASIFGCQRKCGCLEEALCLLRMLSSPSPASSRSSVSSSGRAAVFAASSEPGTDRTEDAVLRENHQAIDAINSMLSCLACADDTFFLTVVSMIILKTLERYAAAARPSSQPHQEADTSPDGAAAATRLASNILLSSQDQMRALARRDNRCRERTAAQLVLGELHRVQRLVNQLSPRLKRSKDGAAGACDLGSDVGLLRGGGGVVSRPAAVGAAVDVTRGVTGSPETEPTCFSANTLDQIERDVRWNLAALSAAIIKRLRQD